MAATATALRRPPLHTPGQFGGPALAVHHVFSLASVAAAAAQLQCHAYTLALLATGAGWGRGRGLGTHLGGAAAAVRELRRGGLCFALCRGVSLGGGLLDRERSLWRC